MLSLFAGRLVQLQAMDSGSYRKLASHERDKTIALPALRVSGPYLAMVTLAFGTIIQILINEMDFLTNGRWA